jgi:hypothetical protein
LEYPDKVLLLHALIRLFIIGNDDIKIFSHDLSEIDEVHEKIDIPIGLFLEERIRLLDSEGLELIDITLAIDLERTHDDLNREIESIEKSLIAHENRVLLFHRFQVKIQRKNLQNHPR